MKTTIIAACLLIAGQAIAHEGAGSHIHGATATVYLDRQADEADDARVQRNIERLDRVERERQQDERAAARRQEAK